MMFLWVYAYNLRWPVVTFCVLGIALCLLIGFWSLGVKGKTQFASPENGDARWRTLTSTQSGVILAVIAAMFWAIPSPQYDEKIVYRDRVVEKKVPMIKFTATKLVTRTTPAVYQPTYDACINSIRVTIDVEQSRLCHEQAVAAVKASQPQPKEVEKIVYRESTYKVLYDSCNENLSGGIQQLKDAKDIVEARQRRMEFCHKAALETRQFR